MPISLSWRLIKVEGLFKGYNNQVRRAHVKVVKINTVVQRPISRLYKVQGKEDNVNSDILNKDNTLAETYMMTQIPVQTLVIDQNRILQ